MDEERGTMGWGVWRPEPWHLVGVFDSPELAEAAQAAAGDEYVWCYGVQPEGTDNFIVYVGGENA